MDANENIALLTGTYTRVPIKHSSINHEWIIVRVNEWFVYWDPVTRTIPDNSKYNYDAISNRELAHIREYLPERIKSAPTQQERWIAEAFNDLAIESWLPSCWLSQEEFFVATFAPELLIINNHMGPHGECLPMRDMMDALHPVIGQEGSL